MNTHNGKRQEKPQSLVNKINGMPYHQVNEPVSILMPVCNEAEAIESILAELVEVVYRHLPSGSEFLIEEGGSTDGTKDILHELNERWPFLKINYKTEKEGFAQASRELYRRATCPLVFFIDSDGQAVPSDFWKLAKQIQGCDFVIGAKKVHYDPAARRLTSKVFNSITRFLFHTRLRDINFGFRLCRRDAVLKCLKECKYMPTLLNAEVVLIALLLGHRICEVDVYHRPRLFGLSRGLQASLFRESWWAFKGLLLLKKYAQQLKDGKENTEKVVKER